MQSERYFGTYARFETKSKKDASALLGADNLVGDVFDIVFIEEDGINIAWMKNRFGCLAGYFDAALSRRLSIFKARGWDPKALLSFVAFTDSPDPGHYWGQAAIICYDPAFSEPFSTFVQGLSARLSDGIRPDVDLGTQAVDSVLQSNGTWQPKKTIPLPSREKGTVIMKSRRKMNEKLIEQGRKGNKGCYVVSWAFIFALVALAAFALKSCGVF